MANLLLPLGLALALLGLFAWGFRALPKDRWQFLFAWPLEMQGKPETWRGVNFTWYGVFQAHAVVCAVALFLILVGALNVPGWVSLIAVAVTLLYCLPAAAILARLIERQRYTFTVGGASSVGFVLAPWLFATIDFLTRHYLGWEFPVLPALAAGCICFAFGEGIGRLACISFGCCYGKPLANCSWPLRRLLGRFAITYVASTKKAVYEGGHARVPLVPIQAISAIILSLTALVSLVLFTRGHIAASLALSITLSQAWRFASEFLRADFRGGQRISVYQWLALLTPVYLLAVADWLGSDARSVHVNLGLGAASLWNPETILFLQGIWLAVFVYTGRSRVTHSTMTFQVTLTRVQARHTVDESSTKCAA